MPFNGSGVFQRVRNWVADAAAGIKIRADYHDAEDDGFAAGLSNTITRDGQSVVTQNIPWNSKRITGLADPVNDQDASTKKYADNAFKSGGTITGNLTINGDLAVNGKVEAYGYRTRTGLAGPFGDNWFNFFWDGNIKAYIDDTLVGYLATQAYADTAGTNAAANRVLRAGDTMTGKLTTAASAAIASGGSAGSVEIMGAGTNSAMSFHIPAVFGANFGLANDGNFYMGGWSHGATAYRFWTTRDFAALPSGSVIGTRLQLAGNASWTGTQTVSEPFAGSCCTGLSAAAGGGMTGRFRYLQINIGGTWYTVGYTP